jgi:hypothetical protein
MWRGVTNLYGQERRIVLIQMNKRSPSFHFGGVDLTSKRRDPELRERRQLLRQIDQDVEAAFDKWAGDKVLTPAQWRTARAVVVVQRKMEPIEIAEEEGVTRSAVCQRLKAAGERAKEFGDFYGEAVGRTRQAS